MGETAVIFDLIRNSYVDGPGIRTAVFFKGCNLRCAWCHNPESQVKETQLLFYGSKCTDCGKCREKCPNGLESCDLCGKCVLFCPNDARELCGQELPVEEILREVLRDQAYYRTSGGGITCTGGECMLQPEALGALLRLCREAGIHTAVDTAGHVPFEFFERILPDTDLFLYDIKCMDEEKHRRYTGVGNRRILENLRQLLLRGARVLIRVPVIPGVNASVEEMEAIRDFLKELPPPEGIELLPYHAMGEHKYTALNREPERFSVPEPELMAQLRQVFSPPAK